MLLKFIKLIVPCVLQHFLIFILVRYCLGATLVSKLVGDQWASKIFSLPALTHYTIEIFIWILYIFLTILLYRSLTFRRVEHNLLPMLLIFSLFAVCFVLNLVFSVFIPEMRSEILRIIIFDFCCGVIIILPYIKSLSEPSSRRFFTATP